MERHILREGTSSCPISSSWSQGVPTLASLFVKDDTNTSDQLCVPGSTLGFDWTDCLKLTARFSYHLVSFQVDTCSTGHPQCTATPLFTNHNMTACQNTQGSPGTNPKSMSIPFFKMSTYRHFLHVSLHPPQHLTQNKTKKKYRNNSKNSTILK